MLPHPAPSSPNAPDAPAAPPPSPVVQHALEQLRDVITRDDRLEEASRALLTDFVPRLGAVEDELARLHRTLAAAVLQERDDATQRDLVLLAGRSQSALQTVRELHGRILDLAGLARQLGQDALAVDRRAIARGYPGAAGA